MYWNCFKVKVNYRFYAERPNSSTKIDFFIAWLIVVLCLYMKKMQSLGAPLKISDIPLLSTLGTIEHIELCRIKIYSETLPISMRSSLRTRAIDICCRAFKFGSPRFQWDSINLCTIWDKPLKSIWNFMISNLSFDEKKNLFWISQMHQHHI